jgi:NTE family protein
MSEESMPDFGLVLSSDGSKSSFEIGAWKALREMNAGICAVSASFVGALNAALIAQGDFENAVRFWKNIYAKDLFGINRHIARHYTEDWSKSDTKYFKKSFLKYIQGRSEELDPLKTNINIFIDEKKVRNSSVQFGFVSVSMNTLEAEMLTIDKIPKGKLTQYLLVASCFPQITQVNRAADPQFSSLYSPYNMLSEMACKKILTTDEAMIVPKDLNIQVDTISAHELIELNMAQSAEEMRRNIKMGYLDTLNVFHPTAGSYFMIENTESAAYNLFQDKFGEKFSNKIDDLVKLLLHELL